MIGGKNDWGQARNWWWKKNVSYLLSVFNGQSVCWYDRMSVTQCRVSGLPYMPLDIAIGKKSVPHCPSGHHGQQFWHKNTSCFVLCKIMLLSKPPLLSTLIWLTVFIAKTTLLELPSSATFWGTIKLVLLGLINIHFINSSHDYLWFKKREQTPITLIPCHAFSFPYRHPCLPTFSWQLFFISTN